MKKFSMLDLAALVVWLLPLVYLWSVYATLPATVPVHFGINGTVDRYGSKSELLTLQAILLFAALFVYLLLKFLPSIDPKKQVKVGEQVFQKLAFGLLVFFSALNITILFATAHNGFKIDKLMLPLVGLLLAFIGNMMHSIKPNYFAGMRTPWALENEDNWRATHRLAGKLWFTGGILLTIATLLLPSNISFIVFISSVIVMTFWPFIFSYQYFKKHQTNKLS